MLDVILPHGNIVMHSDFFLFNVLVKFYADKIA